MNNLPRRLVLPLLLLVSVPLACQTPADTVFLNGPIYTVAQAQPWATGLAVTEGEIVYVGDSAGAAAYIGPATRVIDLAGRLALPGLHDSHVHILEASHQAQATCFLPAGVPPESQIARLIACAPNQVGTDWVLGYGYSIWDLRDHIDAGGRPPVEILDTAVADRPVAILEETSHSVWANTLAIEAAGFDTATEDPVGGVIVRDQTGKPNGIFLDAAGEILLDLALAPNPELQVMNREALLFGLQLARANGITSLVDARGHWRRGYIEAYQQVEAEGLLTARVVVSLWAYPYLDDAAQIAALTALYSNDPNRRLRFSQVKVYTDGEISHTSAALLDPYLCCTLAGPRGLNYFDEARLTKYLIALQAAGFDFHIHAIGDRGVHQALNAIEAAANSCSPPAIAPCADRRHRLTHVEMVQPSDIPRFAALGVTADLQMSHPGVEPSSLFDLAFLLGITRIEERQWRLRDLYEAGANVVLSSDYDVGSLSAFEAMERAISRGDQSLPDLAAAVRAYTINAAYLMRQENLVGSLEVGKRADIIVVDRNIFEIPIPQISETGVDLTMVDGTIVFGDPGVNLLFADGFESAGTGAWASVVLGDPVGRGVVVGRAGDRR